MMDASTQGRLRNLLQQAQTLCSELRGLPLDHDAQQLLPRVFELARLVNRLQHLCHSLPSDDPAQEAQRATWLQRAQWLQQDAAALANERIYSDDRELFMHNLMRLLFSGADACDRALKEKIQTDGVLEASRRQLAELQARCAAVEEANAQLQSAQSAAGEELIMLRSSLAVAQQESAGARAHVQELTRQLQAANVELSTTRASLEEARAEAAGLQELADSRVQVIQTLMERAEEQQAAAADAAKLAAHCSALSAGLEANAQVVDKLIQLNADLMDELNMRTAAAAATAAATAAAAATDTAAGLAPPQLPVSTGVNGTGGNADTRAHVGMMVSKDGVALPAPAAAGSSGTCAHAGSGPGPPPAAAPSLADAFSRFLIDNDSPPRQTARPAG